MLPIHIIFNEVANRGKSIETLNQMKAYFNKNKITYTIHNTEYIGHAKEISDELTKSKTPMHIFVVGGDGTLHEVINTFHNMDKHLLSIIPAGSGNDFVTNFNASYTDLNQVLDRMIKQKPQYVDYLSINEDRIRCMNVLGFGIDSRILDSYKKMKHGSPKARYKRATIKHCLHPKSNRCKIWVDDAKPDAGKELRTIIFTISNGVTIGGGIKVAPDAKIDDGNLAISYVGKLPWYRVLPSVIKLSKGNIKKIKTWNGFTCKKIKLQLDTNMYECDGEIYQDTSTLNVAIVHNKLRVVI